jgi:hypothetical protein
MLVEGHGEVAAGPRLVGRCCHSVKRVRPIRIKRQRVADAHEQDRLAVLVRNALGDARTGAVLVMLDADDDCAATLGPTLEAALGQRLPGVLVRCALAVREFESWLLAGRRDVGDVDDRSRGGKAKLITLVGRYRPTVDQPRLTSELDLAVAQARSRSFRRLLKVLAEIEALAARAAASAIPADEKG